ncbi:hypothetical protein QE152_g29809 [Popillia japonica]|uniref:Uncharacterized protein n=1 Tax=Popillia japonica TaxID=7064 RepID=A0AAW1JGU0_POPJA
MKQWREKKTLKTRMTQGKTEEIRLMQGVVKRAKAEYWSDQGDTGEDWGYHDMTQRATKQDWENQDETRKGQGN